jgi:anti-sigma factor RsiW
VNPACQDLAPLLTLRAAGALDPLEARRVEAHLESCERCRAEADADAAVLGLARLPPVSEAERRVAADLPERILAAMHRGDRRRGITKRTGAITAVAAAAALLLLLPALSRLRAPDVAPAPEAVAAWQEPDPEAFWDDTDLLYEDASSTDSLDAPAAALAALDAGVGR